MPDHDLIAPRLEVISGDRIVRTVPVKVGTTLIGRSERADIHYDDTRISRDHARVERREGGGCLLTDTSRHRATFLNGRRLPDRGPIGLSHGDVIRVVEHDLVFRAAPTVIADDREGMSTVLQTVIDIGTVPLARRSTRPADAFRAVLELNRALGGGGTLDEILARALDRLMELFPKTDCGLIATAEPDGALPIRAIRKRSEPPPKLTLSTTILHRVIECGEALLIQDVCSDQRFRPDGSAAVLFRSALCVPLQGHDGKPVGMVQLGGGAGRRDDFSADDLDMLIGLAVPMGVAVENDRLIRDRATLSVAREIERFLMPREVPEVPGYAFWQCYRPALEVGGDLYNYVRAGTDDPRWAVCVGDVTGKGIPAALISVATNPEIRQAVASGASPAEVLRWVNRRVCAIGFENHYVSLIVTQLDPVAHRVVMASAGHEPPFLRRASGAVERVELTGVGQWLGFAPTVEYPETVVTLEPGDVLLLYSDGLQDSRDRKGNRLGYDPLELALAAAPPGVEAAGEALLKVVDEHARGRTAYDDLTIVGFGRDPD